MITTESKQGRIKMYLNDGSANLESMRTLLSYMVNVGLATDTESVYQVVERRDYMVNTDNSPYFIVYQLDKLFDGSEGGSYTKVYSNEKDVYVPMTLKDFYYSLEDYIVNKIETSNKKASLNTRTHDDAVSVSMMIVDKNYTWSTLYISRNDLEYMYTLISLAESIMSRSALEVVASGREAL